MMTRWARPVTSSISSRIVTSSITSRKAMVPVTSVRIGVVNGSHSRMVTPPFGTRAPSRNLILAPGTTGYRSFSRPFSSCRITSPFRFRATTSPSRFSTHRMLW